jgi:hypothetical protein
MKVSSVRKFVQPFVQFAALALVLMGCIPLASAQGYDLFQTGAGASVDLSSIKLGVVPLQGVPIWAKDIGNTDTIIQRLENIPAGGGTSAIVMVALNMKSAKSVTFQGQPADVYITVNNSGGIIPTTVVPQPDQIPPSSGRISVRSDGTFDSSITVTADAIIVRAGTSPTDPKNYLGHQAASAVTLTSTASTWSAKAPAGYPVSSLFPQGGFVPIKVNHDRSHHPILVATTGIINAAGTK